MEQNNDQSLFGLSVDAQARSFLSETAKWGKFFAILGFIGSVILVLVGVIVATNYEEFEKAINANGNNRTVTDIGPAIGIIYVVGAIIYFFPCLYLLKFSNQIKTALASDDQTKLTSAFKNLKSMFRFVGVLTIILIALFIVASIVNGLSGI